MKKIDHIGIAVSDLNNSTVVFEKLLNTTAYKTESVLLENVLVSFFKTGETKLELLQATSPESTIAKFITKKGEGIHHIAFEVDDIYAEIKRLVQEGFEVLSEPKKGADNRLIVFLNPRNTNSVLIELCQTIK